MASISEPTTFFLDCFHTLRKLNADSDLLDHFCAPGADFQPSATNLDAQLVSHLSELRVSMLATEKFRDGVTRLCESYYSHLDIYQILSEKSADPDDVFAAYVGALQLHDPDLSNDTVMGAVWKVFESRTDSESLQKIRNLFAEHELEIDVGLDENTLSSVRSIVSDDALYRDILKYIQLTQSSNLSWPEVLEMTQSMVLRRSPAVWPPLESVLESWRDARVTEFLEDARALFHDEQEYTQFVTSYLSDPDVSLDEVLARLPESDAERFADGNESASEVDVERLTKNLRRLSMRPV